MITAGIGFDDACINRKALALHKACVHAGTDHRLEHLAQDVAIAKPAVAVNRERRMIGNLVIELEAAEPTRAAIRMSHLGNSSCKCDPSQSCPSPRLGHSTKIHLEHACSVLSGTVPRGWGQ